MLTFFIPLFGFFIFFFFFKEFQYEEVLPPPGISPKTTSSTLTAFPPYRAPKRNPPLLTFPGDFPLVLLLSFQTFSLVMVHFFLGVTFSSLLGTFFFLEGAFMSIGSPRITQLAAYFCLFF